MMRVLVSACLKGRRAVILLMFLLFAASIYAANSTPIDAFPEFAPPLIEVQTEAPGLSSLQVEELVTTPIENALAGTSFSTNVRSKSVLGLSSVQVHFEPGTDLIAARQFVQERLTLVTPLLPSTVRAPTMLAPVSSTARILKIGLTSNTLSQSDLTDLVRIAIRPRLLAVPGIASVAVWGERQREYTVEIIPDQMLALGVSTDELRTALSGATQMLPGGYLDGALQRIPVQHVNRFDTPEALARLPVATRRGATIHLQDVAQIIDSFPPPIGDAVVNDEPGILLIVSKQPWGNTLEITDQIDRALNELGPVLPEVSIDAQIFRPASFIRRSIANLEHALLLGCLLVIGILFLFLWNWRTALISAISIPLSLGIAILVSHLSGATLNTMILAGLVIALGEVVDDSIIDVENIHRRLLLNSALEKPRSAIAVALDASLEVRGAVVYATAIVLLVFLPVWFLSGISGSFFRPLALSYALAVLASMAVALTVTPALSLILLPTSLARQSHSPLMALLQNWYRFQLPRFLAWPRTILASALAVLFATALGFSMLGSSFLPDFRENDLLMHWVAEPGTSLAALRRTTLLVSKDLRSLPGIDHFGAHLGRAESADEIVGPNFAELWVHVDSKQDHEQTVSRVKQTLSHYPGIRRDVETYLREKIDEVLSGASGAIVVRIFGPDLQSLRQGADDLALKLRQVKEVKSARVEQQVSVPELQLSPRPEAAGLGFLPSDIRRSVSLLVKGEQVGEVIRNAQSIPIVLRGPQNVRENQLALSESPLVSATGARARLRDVAHLELLPTPGAVLHEAGMRRIDISLTVTGELGQAAAQVKKLVSQFPLPAAHHAEILGEWHEREKARSRLIWTGLLSLAGIVLLLRSDLVTWRRTFIVLLSLPFALAGGVVGAWLTGGVLSLGSLVGLVTVLGIAARNGILLVTHYMQLEKEGGAMGRELVEKGTMERLGPILMTALATAMALVPLVWFGDQPGHEIEHPMAVVILGGLLSSTVMNLVVMPALYMKFSRSRATQAIA